MNYIKAHKSLALLMKNDINLKPSQKSFMDTLFCVWNEKKWAKEFLVSRDDLMESCKISNRKTYYATVNSLVDMGYITYVPSKNPEVASKFGMGKKVTSHGLCHGISDGASDGASSVTLYKLLNNKTIKLIGQYPELINEKLQSWINSEEDNKDKEVNSKIPSLQEVESFAIEFALKHKKDKEQCLFLATKGYNNYLENDWKDVKGSPIKNWKTKLQNSYISLDKLKDAVDEEKLQYDKSFTWLLQGNRVFEDLDYCLMAYNSGQARPTEKMHLENVLKYNKMI